MRRARTERGTALVITLILALAGAAVTAALGEVAHDLAQDVEVRRRVLCARYAALAGISLGPASEDRAGTVGEFVTSIVVTAVLKQPGWCVYRSVAVCGDARRTVERTMAVEACGP